MAIMLLLHGIRFWIIEILRGDKNQSHPAMTNVFRTFEQIWVWFVTQTVLILQFFYYEQTCYWVFLIPFEQKLFTKTGNRETLKQFFILDIHQFTNLQMYL